MNRRICLVIAVVFIFVFSVFFLFNDAFMKISEDKFYSQEFDSSKKKILIYGSSHLLQLNSTHIKDRVTTVSENYSVFNMAENGDKPKKRSLNIDRDLELEPEIVIYGVGFRDFSLEQEQSLQTELDVADLIPFDTIQVETLNPKLTTLQVLRSFTIDLMKSNEKTSIPYPNTSIFADVIQEKIASSDELRKDSESVGEFIITTKDNEQLDYFRTIIQTLQENNVKVVVMATPYHSLAIEKIPEIEKMNFYKILSDIEHEFGVQVYDYSNKYEGLSIWRDTSHVALNQKSIVFSNDFAQMIIQEIEE